MSRRLLLVPIVTVLVALAWYGLRDQLDPGAVGTSAPPPAARPGSSPRETLQLETPATERVVVSPAAEKQRASQEVAAAEKPLPEPEGPQPFEVTAAPVSLAPTSPVAPLPDPFAERHAGSSAADRAARVVWIVNTVTEHFRNPKSSTLTDAEIQELRTEQAWLQSHPEP